MRLLGLLLLLICCSVHAAEIVYFYDGDTVKIRDGEAVYKLRIADIDAPERNQTYGKKSRRALMQLCEISDGLQPNIHAALSGTDKYGRKLGKLFCHDQDISLLMLEQGHAWRDRFNLNRDLILAEDHAKKQKLGLWQYANPMPPWIWRKQFGGGQYAAPHK